MKSITTGIDLAAAPKRTAVASLAWHDRGATVTELGLGADDATLLKLLRGPSQKVGIDCPLGWPAEFVEFVASHHRDELPRDVAGEPGWKRTLAYRATDFDVRRQTGLVPLSVAADRIAHVAFRCAAVLAHARACGVDVSRDGSGTVAEVYPAAALKLWGLPFRGYKGAANADARARLVAALQERAPWLDLAGHEPAVRSSDDLLDAIVCALMARAVGTGNTTRSTTPAAAQEGWIHLPRGDLSRLVGS